MMIRFLTMRISAVYAVAATISGNMASVSGFLRYPASNRYGRGVRQPQPQPSIVASQNTRLCEQKKYNVKAAMVELTWEAIEKSHSRPLLNLSSLHSSRSEVESGKEAQSTVDETTTDWDKGQLWEETKKGLSDRGVRVTATFLKQCPQLLRLAPELVLETADWIVQEFGVAHLESEPRLLGYRPEHVKYGLEFMSTMMMRDAKSICKAAPELLLSGVEGGLQEQAVKWALGEAGAATYTASSKIAGDGMSAIQALKSQRKGL